MVTSVSGSGGSGAGAVAVEQASVPAAAAAKPAAAQEDTVKISATFEEVQQPTSAQVRLLHAEGQSIPQIATKLAISPGAVQSYLGTPAQTSSRSK
jgi:DNA-directed RNA polymerase specialized sigma24 family protein